VTENLFLLFLGMIGICAILVLSVTTTTNPNTKMSNMHHIMFENTFRDLQDCESEIENVNLYDETERESKYALKLINLCIKIAKDYQHVTE
jgi:hypothetical protein